MNATFLIPRRPVERPERRRVPRGEFDAVRGLVYAIAIAAVFVWLPIAVLIGRLA